MNNQKKIVSIFVLVLLVVVGSLSACNYGKMDNTSEANSSKIEKNTESISNSSSQKSDNGKTDKKVVTAEYYNYTLKEYDSKKVDPLAPVIKGLKYKETVALDYAQCFQIFRYEGGYSVIRVDDGRDYILIPKDGKVPEDLPSSTIIIKKPLNRIYLVASAAMSFFDSLDRIDNIRLSGIKADNWYIDSAKKAMDSNKILFAGKYSEPDYELILNEKTDLAIESTMISHTPEVQEKLEGVNIPVFVDRSSYETHPLGRTEWMKVYAELTDSEENCKLAFVEQRAYVDALEDFENTKKTVAFFYVNSNGVVVTRKTSDYFSKMIELAGGKYVFDKLGDEESASTSVEMTMEEFYASAKDSDYLIYNATIDSPISSVDELIGKNQLFKDFKAVKEGNVWCTKGQVLYQGTNQLGGMISDINIMLTDNSATKLSFVEKLK